MGKRSSRYQGASLDQHQMAAHVERWGRIRETHGILKGIAIRHQSSRGKDAINVRVNDALIYIARKPEVVGIDNELFQPYWRLENMQLDAQVFLRIGSKVFERAL